MAGALLCGCLLIRLGSTASCIDAWSTLIGVLIAQLIGVLIAQLIGVLIPLLAPKGGVGV